MGVVWTLMQSRQILILKARQLGISWLVCGYVLWLCLFRRGRSVLMFSRGLLEANELVRRVRVMYQRLPDWLRATLPRLVVDNTQVLAWSNGSRVQSLAATENAGRSFTASLVVMDEFAFLEWPQRLYTATKPTIDAGGQLVCLSTANGAQGLFYDLWQRAEKQQGEFVPVFLPWHVRPDRDVAWYRRVQADAVDPLLFQQEYPATADEAFVSTNRSPFLPDISWWDANARTDLPVLTSETPIVCAADAAVSGDTFAFVAVASHDDGRIRECYTRLWVPEGDGTDLDFVAIRNEVRTFCRAHRVLQVAYDPYQLHGMMQELMQDGAAWTEPFNQGAPRLEADKMLLDGIRDGRLLHRGASNLREHIANADRKIEGTDRLRIVKRRDDLKIDAAVALSMAYYRAKTDFGM